MSKLNNSKKYPKNIRYNPRRKQYIIISIIAIISVFILLGAYIFSGLPSLEELENPTPVLASKVFSIDGELIGQFFIENRIEVKLDSIPKHAIYALIATEDRRFYDHWGVDVERFVKAMVKNVFSLSLGEGASTITQQLAKNLYKLKSSNESVFGTITRKIREWITAVQIEKTYTKDEILEMYLNISYFGRGAHGIQTASRIFFNKEVEDLKIQEAAMLVALLKSSAYYDPIKHPQNALRRRNIVLYSMVDAGYMDKSLYERIKKAPIELGSEKPGKNLTYAPHFMENVRQQMQKICDAHGYDLYKDGLNIYTTLDSRMQKIANQAAKEHLDEYQALFDKYWKWEKQPSTLKAVLDKAIRNDKRYRGITDPIKKTEISERLKNNQAFVDSVKNAAKTIQVGFVAVDPSNGHIRAMVGGRDYDFLYGLNHATNIKRQPGSAFKPFIFATAIENGLYPQFPLLNEEFNYNGWTPHNSDLSTGGYTPLREGLKNSLNLITARLIIEGYAPLEKVGDLAKRMGIKSKLDLQPSISLGTSEVSPLEIVSAYSTFANRGLNVAPISILRVEDKDGILIEKFYSDQITEAISEETAAIVTDMMQTVVDFGTGAGVRKYFHRPAAGKTGTTQDFSDAWFVGFTPQLAAGVWVGFDDRRVQFTGWYGQGAKAAGPIWAKFMAGVYKEIEMPLEYFPLPGDVVLKDFCMESIEKGSPMIANEYCPNKISDLVVTGKEPPACDIHKGGTIWPF